MWETMLYEGNAEKKVLIPNCKLCECKIDHLQCEIAHLKAFVHQCLYSLFWF